MFLRMAVFVSDAARRKETAHRRRIDPRPDPERPDAQPAPGGLARWPGLLGRDAHPQGRGHRGLLRRAVDVRNSRKSKFYGFTISS